MIKWTLALSMDGARPRFQRFREGRIVMTAVLKLALCASAALLVIGCGSSPERQPTDRSSADARKSAEESQKPPTSVDNRRSVCTMIPKAEMETILGGALTSAEAKDAPGRSQCTYVGFGRYADVVIERGNGEAGMAGARLAAKLMGATAGAVTVMTPIEGLGDEAMLMIGG